MNIIKLEGKTALVTGASRGLGKQLAMELARKGARVILVARGQAELEQAAAEIRASGGEAHALAYDVADKQSVLPLAGAAAAVAGPIDILIHNASTLGPVPLRSLLVTQSEELEEVLAVNLVGPFRITKALAGPMALRGEGLVVHISSDAAVSAYQGWGAYGASKAALDHLGRIWAAELEETGVRFLAFDPGEMNTRMHADAMPDADPSELADPADVARRIVSALERAPASTGSRVSASDLEAAS